MQKPLQKTVRKSSAVATSRLTLIKNSSKLGTAGLSGIIMNNFVYRINMIRCMLSIVPLVQLRHVHFLIFARIYKTHCVLTV